MHKVRQRERERASERKVYNVAKLDAVVMFRFTHTHEHIVVHDSVLGLYVKYVHGKRELQHMYIYFVV